MADSQSHLKPEARDCPLCGNRASDVLRDPTAPVLLRCRQCDLLFRESPVRAVVDHRLGPDELEHLAEARTAVFNKGLRRLEYYRKTNRLLDVGCGSGHFASLAATSWSVVALESDEHLCSVARQEGSFEVLRATAEALPARAESFDVVALWDVLDHLESPMLALQEAHRVLRPGGLVHLRVRNGRVHHFMKRTRLIPNSMSVLHNILFSTANLKTALQSAGFTEVHTGVAQLTRGNPYRQGRGPRDLALRGIKAAWELGARLLASVSRQRYNIAPSIQATARRREP